MAIGFLPIKLVLYVTIIYCQMFDIFGQLVLLLKGKNPIDFVCSEINFRFVCRELTILGQLVFVLKGKNPVNFYMCVCMCPTVSSAMFNS